MRPGLGLEPQLQPSLTALSRTEQWGHWTPGPFHLYTSPDTLSVPYAQSHREGQGHEEWQWFLMKVDGSLILLNSFTPYCCPNSAGNICASVCRGSPIACFSIISSSEAWAWHPWTWYRSPLCVVSDSLRVNMWDFFGELFVLSSFMGLLSLLLLYTGLLNCFWKIQPQLWFVSQFI